MQVERFHHVAYRCLDAKQTVEWYVKHLNMNFVLAIAEDQVPSTKAPDPYMHVFLDAGQGNVLAFFELPGSLVAGGSAAGSGVEVLLYSKLGEQHVEWPATLTRTEGVLDTRTRTLYSVVQIADPYGLYGSRYPQPLLIGTYVNAEIAGRLLDDVYVIPRHTLEAGDLVWVADGENRLRGRKVNLVTANGDVAYVADGFLPGDRLVLTRLESPLNGMAVQAAVLPSALD